MQKQAQTSLLNIAYKELDEAHAPVIILIHDFPDDAQTWNDVRAPLANMGYRAICSYTVIRPGRAPHTPFVFRYTLTAIDNKTLLLQQGEAGTNAPSKPISGK